MSDSRPWVASPANFLEVFAGVGVYFVAKAAPGFDDPAFIVGALGAFVAAGAGSWVRRDRGPLWAALIAVGLAVLAGIGWAAGIAVVAGLAVGSAMGIGVTALVAIVLRQVDANLAANRSEPSDAMRVEASLRARVQDLANTVVIYRLATLLLVFFGWFVIVEGAGRIAELRFEAAQQSAPAAHKPARTAPPGR